MSFIENDVVRLRRAVIACVIGGGSREIASGVDGTVVLVYGNTEEPTAYEIEFYVPELDVYAIATVDAGDVCSTSNEAKS